MNQPCAWCDDTGFLYLRRYVTRKRKRVAHTFNKQVKRWAIQKNVTYPMGEDHRAELRRMQNEAVVEDRFTEQVLGTCRRCKLGEDKHRRMPWMPHDYRLEEVDVALENYQVSQLDSEQRERYYEVRKAAAAMESRSQELAAPDEMEYWSAGGPNADTMQPDGPAHYQTLRDED